MYKLPRLFFGWSVVLGVYVIVVAAAMMGTVAVYVLIGVAVLGIRKAYQKRAFLTTLASGRFATEEEIDQAGMLDAKTGLILGRLGGGRSALFERIRLLFSSKLKDKEACDGFWKGKQEGKIVRLPQAYHTVCFAPSRSGKGASLILPWLFSVNESAIVIDLKGENALLTAEWREKHMGQKVVILDPFKVVTR